VSENVPALNVLILEMQTLARRCGYVLTLVKEQGDDLDMRLERTKTARLEWKLLRCAVCHQHGLTVRMVAFHESETGPTGCASRCTLCGSVCDVLSDFSVEKRRAEYRGEQAGVAPDRV
jgi:hypothetical protein